MNNTNTKTFVINGVSVGAKVEIEDCGNDGEHINANVTLLINGESVDVVMQGQEEVTGFDENDFDMARERDVGLEPGTHLELLRLLGVSVMLDEDGDSEEEPTCTFNRLSGAQDLNNYVTELVAEYRAQL